ncbi:hypothetical protein Poli38472_014098 [Pythium oligandrum]|uniref:Uncharacterized protein n=1 Tax=Pythium oligandrum TaxID=41045 RepID=A0A8K1CNA6_PYTOL|nr:hypothetical protein Poli38472_014098 [Pythium oligandrum]|eukprot:TMW66786.1 hypothetical protein Poli38472_014098 [Pythium oligandrum]
MLSRRSLSTLRWTRALLELPLVHPWGLLAALLRSPSRLLDRMTAEHHRYLDRVTARVTQNPVLFPHGFFCDGWGDLNTPKRLREVLQSNRMREVNELTDADVVWSPRRTLSTARVCLQEAKFASTLPNAKEFLPASSLDAYFELVTPMEWHASTTTPTQPKTLVVLLPGTGEHGFLHRRAALGIPLARRGIATLILEGPFYGRRRPHDQKGSKLRRVSDLPILGQATIEEAKSLLSYFQREHGYTHLVVAGSSMGGLHAAMTASVYPGEVGATAWLAPPSAVPVFTDGLLAASCNWSSLYKLHELQLLDNMLQGHAITSSSPQEALFHDEDPVQQAKKRMRLFLSITDIDNFHPPRRTDAVQFVVGTEDEYIGAMAPQWQRLQDKWQSAQFRYLKTGHVSGILLEREAFENTIVEVVEQLQRGAVQQMEQESEQVQAVV